MASPADSSDATAAGAPVDAAVPVATARAVPVLGYARPRPAEQPIGSPIIVERLPEGGVRLTDPPRGWAGAGVRGNVVVLAVLGVIILLTAAALVRQLIALAADERRANVSGPLVGLLCEGGMFALLWFETRLRAGKPTIIEVSGGHLTVFRPTLIGGRIRREIARVRDVRASTPMPGVPPTRMYASLMLVRGFGLADELLGARPVDEVRWMAGVLRGAMGLAGGAPVGDETA